MLKRMSLTAAAAALALSLVAPGAHAANPQPVAQAKAGSDPGVLVWIDTDQGTGLDSKGAPPIHDQFAATDWAILDNGTVVVSKDGKPLLTAVWASNQAGTFIPVHGRSGSMTVDGTLYRDEKDMSQGLATLFINQVAKDGKSARSLRISVDLKFGGNSPSPASSDGGFGGF
jgi:hypothetical protein